MKKKLLLLSLFIILLIPFNISAATYTYKAKFFDRSTLSSTYGLDWPTTYYRVSPGDRGYHAPDNHFVVHAVNNEVSICGSIDKNIISDTNLTIHNGISTFKNNLNSTLSPHQQELLMDLLSHGYHHNGTLASVDSKTEVFSLIAMQIIAWEIIEDGRTMFYNPNFSDHYAPDAYHGDDSAYYKIIYPNGGSSQTTGSLYYYYRKILDDCYKATVAAPAAFNGKTYTLVWNQSKNRYETTVNVGNYVNCTSANSHYNVSVSNNVATVSTTTKETSRIDCKYTSGNGTLGQADQFIYYEFPNSGICTNNRCQLIIYGKSIKTYSSYFLVDTESVDLSIAKKNQNNEELSGATFKITSLDNSSNSVTINGNDSAKKIVKSGRYKVSETVVPSGYKALSDFEMYINAKTKRITSCTGETSSSGVVSSCLGGQVKVTYPDNKIVLTITNVADNFTIKKTDENGNEIKGATFKIKDSKNKDVKFIKSGSSYRYSADGTVTDIVGDYSKYYISLLPAGEYSLIETEVPYPYVLPAKESERTTKIKIDNNYKLYQYSDTDKKYNPVGNDILSIKNFKSHVSVLKTGDGKPLSGVKFLLYKEDKTTMVNCTMVNSGKYNYNINQSSTDYTEYVTNSSGKIEFNDLPAGTYYLLETETVEPFVLPEGDAAYTKIVIDITKQGLSVNGSYIISEIEISNSRLSFNFYKIDENGNYLKNGTFKLQKYDEKKKSYRDIKVKSVKNDGKYNENADIFEPSDDGEILFTLKNGIATFINMQASTSYRIVERKAPEGYVRIPISESPTVTIDEYGYSSGLLTLVNKKVSVQTGDARAELIISISTGQQVVRYGLIIGGVVVIIFGLIIFVKKIDKDKGKK